MIRQKISTESITVNYNNKLFPTLVKIINEYTQAYIDKFGHITKPSIDEQDDIIDFSMDFLNPRLKEGIQKYTGLKLNQILISPELNPNAACIYSLWEPKVVPIKSPDNLKIKTNLQLAVDKSSTMLDTGYIDNINNIYPDFILTLNLSLGLLLLPTLYKDHTVIPVQSENIAYVILHEIGHFFYMFDYYTQTYNILEMFDDSINKQTSSQLISYDEALNNLYELLDSGVKLVKQINKPKYKSTLKYMNGLDAKFLDTTMNNISRLIQEINTYKKENVPFDSKKITYLVVLHNNIIAQYWKNILYYYWMYRLIYPSQQTTMSSVKDDERSADDFAVRNGAGVWGIKTMYVFDKMFMDPNLIKVFQTYDFNNINKIRLSEKLMTKLDTIYADYLVADGGLYDSPIDRMERYIKQSYIVLNDRGLDPKTRKQLVKEVTEARVFISKLKSDPKFKQAKAHKDRMSNIYKVFSYNFTTMKEVLSVDYALLQNITMDFIGNEFSYQRDRLGQLTSE